MAGRRVRSHLRGSSLLPVLSCPDTLSAARHPGARPLAHPHRASSRLSFAAPSLPLLCHGQPSRSGARLECSTTAHPISSLLSPTPTASSPSTTPSSPFRPLPHPFHPSNGKLPLLFETNTATARQTNNH
ncbi:hypothetical protein N431DRAFT_137171 [Stipitochalara longipes BDJ]|nr:hypothetical protein N431DRAFT_137171 [Stipitochalara longipes BDJ]